MRIPRLPAVLALASIPVLAGGAIAVADSVSTHPGPQVIIPSTTSTAAHRRGADDPANHDANDDRGNDGAGHDANDDRGNDGAGHDVGDDHGRAGTTVTTGTSPTTVTTAPDDHGNDGPGHDGGDDHGGGPGPG
jgi:hypothetical protein